MSHHQGVTCDTCLKQNFRGKRYKCLICLDYDLCSSCYETRTSFGSHNSNHPMQCILTRSDLDLFFAGENLTNDQPYSFTCPICGRLGFTNATLYEHVNIIHSDNSIQVVCPICATLPNGEPNQVTDDFLSHLNLEHRTNNNNQNQPQTVRTRQRHVRMASNRNRRNTQLFHSTPSGGGNGSSVQTLGVNLSNRNDALDPIAQLLSQLSDVRRVNSAASSSSSSSGQNHFPFERHYDRTSLQRMFRQRRQMPPTHFSTLASSTGGNSDPSSLAIHSNQSLPYVLLDSAVPSPLTTNTSFNPAANSSSSVNTNFLLNSALFSSSLASETDSKKVESLNADRSIFVQELIFTFLSSSVANLQPEQFIRSKSTPPSIQSSVEEICRTTESGQSINNESSMINKINNTSQQPLQMAQQQLQTANSSNQQESNQQPHIISIQQHSDDNVMKTSDQNGHKNDNKMKIETIISVNNNGHNTAPNPPVPPISSNGSRNNESNEINSQQRQKPMPLLMQPTTNGTGVGTASFLGTSPVLPSSTAMNNVNHRLNKVNKVRSSPAIVHHSTGIRHSSLHSTVTGGSVVSHGNLVVSPNGGRRKILRPQPQPTEPPPHYE
ncbi:E3 ubiquitin-protein ligase KCMF1 isoform X2 [Dermatophagoides farinae]|uniref:E3 ubiquitin-protein ligase KCMF1 n=1 Tax=Dermatophagoides farinae TaxID=6954 RepID=A0A9D4NW89_DERFA|nr:di19 zinc finger containing protein [Dermatophagoides farinae]